MRDASEATRSWMFSLLERSHKLETVRAELVHQLGLEVVDAELNAVRTEYNLLHNETIPMSVLPDDMLAVIFEEATTYTVELYKHHRHRC